MSRRKQSNPKPLKRKTEDSLEEVADLLHLPTDLFSVRDPEDDIHEYTVFTKKKLHQGISFGPYIGHVIKTHEESINVIETKDKNGDSTRFALVDDSGGWLKLLKPATPGDSSNAILYHNESVVWCTITADIESETELLVGHRWADEVSPPHSADGFRARTHPKHLLRKNKIGRVKCRDNDENDAKRRNETPFSEVGEEHVQDQNATMVDRYSVRERKSPLYFGDNGRIYNGDISSDAAVKYEPSSPVSPACTAVSPATAVVTKSEAVQEDSHPEGEVSVPYVNGCNYPPAFPYGGTITAAGTGGHFKCETCEVSFNSRQILEVHQAYYCQGKTPVNMGSSDTDTEDPPKTGSPVASDDGENQHPKDPVISTRLHPQAEAPSEDSSALAKRRRTISLNDASPGAVRSTRLFKCPYCSYSSDKKASLTRHVRMHGTSPSADGHCDLPLATPPMARYCANCDIQFASYKNYQVHKEYYCNTRHVHKSVTSTSSPNPGSQQQQQPQQSQQQQQAQTSSAQPRSPENSSTQPESSSKGYNMVLNQPLYAAISTSPLILVPCSYVAGGGLSPAAGLIPAGNIIIPNPASSPDAGSDSQGPNVIPTYTVMPGAATELNTASSPVSVDDTVKEERKSPKVVKDKSTRQESSKSPKEISKDDVEKPLDLSFRKRSAEGAKSTAKPANESGLQVSTFSSSPSSSEENCPPAHPGSSLPILPLINPALDLNLISRAQIQGLEQGVAPLPPVLAPPQVLVKQGTSKCKDCNIVFYKHENYLVHKNRYCAARINAKPESASPDKVKPEELDSSDREETGRGTQRSPVSSPRVSNSRTTPVAEGSDPSETTSSQQPASAMLQYYCMACGIKYTSIDNLRAHQLYYCPKRDMSASQPMSLLPSYARNNQEFKCGKCKNAYPTDELLRQHPCVVQKKCPFCDVYCPTLSAAQRHMVTHTGIKSFRCSLCGYKGHTLRGMRTHIRIHLDKNTSTPEEAYILCMDEGGAEIGCASRKSSGVRLNSERIKSVIGTEPPHVEAAMTVSPISGPSPNIVPSDIVAIKAVPDDPVVTGDTTHWCQICGYSSSYKGNVVRHVKLVHKDLMSTQTMSTIVNSRPSVDNALKPNEQLEHAGHGTSQDAIMAASSTDHSNSSSSLDVKPMINGIFHKVEQQLGLKDKPLLLKTEAVSPPPPVIDSGIISKGWETRERYWDVPQIESGVPMKFRKLHSSSEI